MPDTEPKQRLKVVIAYRYEFARHYAASQGWKLNSYIFVDNIERLRGLRSFDVYFIRAQRYRPTPHEMEIRRAFTFFINILIDRKYDVVIHDATLP